MEEWGLGIKQLIPLKQALLAKWNWRLANEEDKNWKAVVSLKYGTLDEGWTTNDTKKSHWIGVWKTSNHNGV